MATSNTQSGLGQHRPIAIAPTANGLSGPQDEAAATPSMPYTCVTCARRKVRCDKTGPPCSTCQKGRHQCHYEAPAPRKRKRKPVDDVQEKLEEYEDLLKQHGLISRSEKTPSEETLSSIGTTAAPLKGQPTPENQTGKLLAGRGKTRYIDSTLWRALGEEELHPSSDEEDDVDDESGQPKADLSPLNIDPVSAAMYGHASPSRNLIELHPSYETAMKFWDMYVSCVEPVVKTFHVPTGRAMVQRAASNPSSIPKTVECLLFAVYHFAVVAMTDDECAEITSQPRGQLQTIYQDAVRQGLVNVYFLRTTDMNVLHAYVLFLLSARNTYDPHTFWILTGVAVRISQRIGLHRDGEELGLKPFDVEMRRRLFWQLPRLDVMAAQMCGTAFAMPPDAWDTKPPLNVNDEDIFPDMNEPPVERKGATDMIFCLTRTEIGKFHQKTPLTLGNSARRSDAENSEALNTICTAIDELESVIESKFLRYCDMIEPIHCLTMVVGRGAISYAKFRARMPLAKVRSDVSTTEKRELFSLALRILDHSMVPHSSPALKRYAWHLQSFLVGWDSLIWVLNELRKGSTAVVEPLAAWSRIERIYNMTPELSTTKRALYVAVGKLVLRTWDGQPGTGRGIVADPDFIARLRTVLSRREISRPEISEHWPQMNPWVPEDSLLDKHVPQFGNLAGGDTAVPSIPEGFNADTIDWMFWDQLIRDPDAFAIT